MITEQSKKDYLNSPDLLKQYSQAYFKSVDAINTKADKLKPYSQTGLAKFLGINYSAWIRAKEHFKEQPDFTNVLIGIEININANQLEGSMMGIFPAFILNETFWRNKANG